MGKITIEKPKFGTRQIDSSRFDQAYIDAGWVVVESPVPDTPKEVVEAQNQNIEQPKRGRKKRS